MSKDLNNCTFTGRLGREVETKFAASGTAISSFSLAVNGWNGQEEITTWINVKCFGKTAELAGNYLSKGSRVCIQARYQLNQWETAEGEKRSMPEFIANDIVFLDSKPKDGQLPNNAQPQARSNTGNRDINPPSPEDD